MCHTSNFLVSRAIPTFRVIIFVNTSSRCDFLTASIYKPCHTPPSNRLSLYRTLFFLNILFAIISIFSISHPAKQFRNLRPPKRLHAVSVLSSQYLRNLQISNHSYLLPFVVTLNPTSHSPFSFPLALTISKTPLCAI